jgi:segregation and condensation protein B
MAAKAQKAFNPDLADLPPALQWREWMGCVEAAIFAARDPVPREALARLVGPGCNLDHLLADIIEELRARPYDLVFVAGGYQLRTRPRFVEAIRAVNGEAVRHAGPSSLTRTEMLTLTAIAYLQPATRAQISRLVGREISRDVIATLRRHALVEAALRAPEPGAPIAYVTTRKFLQVFSLGSLRDLPDIEKLEEEGVLEARHSDIDEVLGVSDELEDRLLEFE